MLARMKLSHKGIALVGILLAFELIFVAALASLLNEAERTAQKESHSKDIVGKTNHVMQLLYDAGTAAAAYQNQEGGPDTAANFHAAVDKIPAEIEGLKSIVRNNKGYYERVSQIERTSIKTLALVSHCMKFAENGDMAGALMAGQRIKKVYSKNKEILFTELRALMSEQEKIIADSPAAQARARQLEKQLLLIGVGINILIAIAMVIFFVRGITKRLDVMVSNTSLLAKGQPLLPALAGSDEISTLDHSFHDMARSMKELEETKQQFLAMVSHDLRSPLTSLGLFLEMVSDGTYGQLSESGMKRTAVAERSVTRLIALINDLLDFEKLQSGQFNLEKKSFALAPVVARSLDAVSSLADQSKVKLQSDPIDFEAYADDDRVIQILVNLISNAVKFSPEGGTVTVSATRSDSGVELRVADQGRGIPADFQSTIFEKFKQVKKTDATEKGGTGLGLAICKAIVEAHGGKIGVESEEGKGATFWFSLPGPEM